MRCSGLLLASGVWLTIYVACVLFVGSFIFFEVLDVDGSDFAARPAKMAARLSEPQHDDFKRQWLQQPVKIWTGAAMSMEIRQPEPSERSARVLAPPVEPVRQHRAALARSAPTDVPPSA